MTYRYRPSQLVAELARHSQRPAQQPASNVISLASGDPDFETPRHIAEALTQAVAGGYTHYAEHQGDPELREALAEVVSRLSGRTHARSEVVVTHGAAGALAAVILAVVDRGDRVVIPEPSYSIYADAVRMAGGEPVFVPPAADLHLDLDRLEPALRGARLVMLCNPCNPTGVVYRRAELEALATLAIEHDVLILADEAYDRIIFDGYEFTSALRFSAIADRLVYVQSFSKTYAMTGWRLGYLVAPPEIAAAATRIHRTLNISVNAAIQRAGLAALATPPEVIEAMRAEYQARRELVVRGLDDIPGLALVPPEGTFYAFVRYPQAVSALDMVALALKHGLAVRPGTEFGPSGAGHVRIAFSIERRALEEGVRRLRSLFSGAEA